MIAMSEPADDQLTVAGLGKMMTLDLCLAAFAAEAPDALAFCDPPNSAALIGRPPLRLTAAQADRAATRLKRRSPFWAPCERGSSSPRCRSPGASGNGRRRWSRSPRAP